MLGEERSPRSGCARTSRGEEIGVSLATPEKIRKLQRALYVKAKQEPRRRFHCLYDTVWREDILAHAYARCRANGGTPGVDGETFARIGAQGVDRWLGARFVATTSLAAAVSSSADFPGVRLYDLPGSAALAAGRGRFLQLLGMPLSPCCPYPPRRSDRPPRSARGPSCCLRPEAEGSASGVIFFRGHHWVH